MYGEERIYLFIYLVFFLYFYFISFFVYFFLFFALPGHLKQYMAKKGPDDCLIVF